MNKVSKNHLSLWHKLSLLCIALLIISACIWLYFLIQEDITQQEKLNESAKIASKSNFKDALDSKIITDKESLAVETMRANYKTPSSKESNVDSLALSTFQATSEDIYQALSFNRNIAPEHEVPAQVEEVLHAIVVANTEEPSKIGNKDSNREILTKAGGAKGLSNGHYYQEKIKQYPDGYVLQIAGFTNVKLSERFLELKSLENLYHYHKNLAGQQFTVVTSKVFMNKVEANNALLKLPKPLLDRKPWLKPISSVINEINTFKQ